jgi:cephalosporin-C deacetylase-like acetyl esterase
MKTRLLIFLTIFVSSVAPIFAQTRSSADLFAYDRSYPLDVKEESAKTSEGAEVREISFAAARPGSRVAGYLVRPAAKGRFAAVLFFHWYGRPNGDRSQFLPEAIALAKKGTVSFLIQGSFPWSQAPTGPAADRQRVIDQTIDVRRALDLLLVQPGVDQRRVAFVGHDYGAMYGGILAGTDERVKKYILIAGTGSFSDWSLRYWLAKLPDAEKESYRKSLGEVDPITQLARRRSGDFLFQFANSDEHIMRAAAEAFYNAARAKKDIKWYDGEHRLDVEAARQYRLEWLTGHLKLRS